MAAEEGSQLLLHSRELPKANLRIGLKLDEQVYVAVGPHVATGGGAKTESS